MPSTPSGDSSMRPYTPKISLLFLAFVCALPAHAKVVEDKAGTLKALSSIAIALDSPDHHPVHILYVHGIAGAGAGDSELLRDSICTVLKLCEISDWKNDGTEYADKGEFSPNVQPPTLSYLGNPIWTSPQEWQASAPFVVHWVVHLKGHPAVLVVDEINWWPLVLALKCRQVIVPEVHLSGPNAGLLRVCSDASAQDPGGLGRFYPWILPAQAAKLGQIKPRAVLMNRELKTELVDWALSDVLMSVGPLGGILRDGVRQLMAKSAAFDPNAANANPGATSGIGKYDWRSQLTRDNVLDQEFVVVTHSLGSYLLFNTLNPEFANVPGNSLTPAETARKTAEENAVRYIFERTSQMYFFANQLEMLEITNLESSPQSTTTAIASRGLAPAPSIPTSPAENFRALVNLWKDDQAKFQQVLHPGDPASQEKIQVVAWSDPSDIITYRMPKIGDVDVVNLYVKNAAHYFGFLESPRKAHDDYAKNIDVLRVMFKSAPPEPQTVH
ncbi:MAG TPA: hypothetical protein VMT38_04170 [Terracidiphilus sp.]|nr:hypothetical protein [Terracidiphilus sp.]